MKAFLINLFFAVLGGLVGNVTAGPVAQMMDNLQQSWCEADRHLVDGNRLRGEAARLQVAVDPSSPAARSASERLHMSANAAYARASVCGNARAQALLAMAHCWGFGVPVDRAKGINGIRKAASKDPAIAVEWLVGEKSTQLCPDFERLPRSAS